MSEEGRIGTHPESWELPEHQESILRDADADIRSQLRVMLAGNFETYESCQGGAGHSYPEPTIAFHGERGEGFRALAWLKSYGVEPLELRRVWDINDGEPTGPNWKITFAARALRDEAATP